MSEKKRTVDEIKEIDELENFISGCGESNIECISNWLMQDQIREVAEQLWDAGYRKRIEGRWTPRHKDTQAFCTKCGALRDIETQEFWSFCPNCGAKMKGGAE